MNEEKYNENVYYAEIDENGKPKEFKKLDGIKNVEILHKVNVIDKECALGITRRIECPKCKCLLHFGYNHIIKFKYCFNCGIQLDWSEIK